MLTNAARWSLDRGNAPVPSRWQATKRVSRRRRILFRQLSIDFGAATGMTVREFRLVPPAGGSGTPPRFGGSVHGTVGAGAVGGGIAGGPGAGADQLLTIDQ